MTLTADEHVDLVGLIEQAWGGHNETLTSLLLESADPKKLRRLLLDRARDLVPIDPETANKLKAFAAKL